MLIKSLGLSDYQSVFEAMQAFTHNRTADTEDQLWVVEHPKVFTQGMAGKAEHLLIQSAIPVVQVDRGGQITYHGPGQLVIYTLIDFKRLKISVRELVRKIENSIISTLDHYHIKAKGDVSAPGVYVNNKKIAALGLRIKNGAVYHGLSLNINMDLIPFSYINPCGYAGLEVTQIADFVSPCPNFDEVAQKLTTDLCHFLQAESTS